MSRPADCPHDLGPTTTVCLRCRYEERVAAHARRKRIAVSIGLSALAFGVAAAGANVARDRGLLRPLEAALAAPAPISSPASSTTDDGALDQPTRPTPPDNTAEDGALDELADPVAEPQPPGPPLAPIIPEGRTSLAPGISAVRTGEAVAVYFDTPLTRTRRAEKFERIVRGTLPEVYGPAVNSALEAIAAGALVPASGLVTELPRTGLDIPLGSGWRVALKPETRAGENGPLVVAYRAIVKQ